jgi:hypothetical protein
MAQRTIPLTRLMVGMYLIGVDRSWLQTPFLRHKFKIKNQSEIEALRDAGIAEVTIDTEQGLDIADHELTGSASIQTVLVEHSMPSDCKTPSVAASSSPPSAVMLAENFAQAKQRRAEWIHSVSSLFEQTRMTGLVPYAATFRFIDEIIGHILDQQAAYYAVLGLQQSDRTLHEHGLTVCTLSVMLGHAMNYPPELLQQLGVGGLMHDIGLTRLPWNIVKRRRTMPPAQQVLYESHAAQGSTILEKSGSFDQTVLAIVKGHHLATRIEQTGERSEAHQESIKLVGVIDQYDELVTGQTGLTPMSSHQALTQLYQRYQADEEVSQVVSYLIRAIGVYPLYSVVSLSSGELAIVGAITAGKAHLPLLYICRDQTGKTCLPPVRLNLIHESEDGRTIRDVRDAVREGLDVEAVLRQVAA